MKKPNVGTKSALIGNYSARIWKQDCRIWYQHPRICLVAKFWEKKCLSLGPKMLYFGIFGLEFKKTLLYFKSPPSNSYNCKILVKNKMPKFGTKTALFLEFLSWIHKQYCHIWNQHPLICLAAKFREKTKMPKFKTKSALFWYYFGIFGLKFEKIIVIFGISTLEFVKLQNFKKKQKCLKFRIKNTSFRYFWARISRTNFVFEISTVEFA